MKPTIDKYRTLLICLSIILTLSIVNIAALIGDAGRKQGKMETTAETSMEQNSVAKENIGEKTHNKEKENTYREERDILDIENSEDEEISSSIASNHSNSTDEEKAESTKVESTRATRKSDQASQNTKHNSSPSANINGDRYIVKTGDSLFLIAEATNMSVNRLKEINNLTSDIIYENQVLNLKPVRTTALNETSSRGSDRNDDLYWLSRIIHSEAQGESYQGKVAVGNVIINRVNSDLFPNTIKGVIFDRQNGYTQFSPVLDGSIYNTPDAESVRAAREVLNGARPVGDALYFLNPRKSTNFWIVGNRKHMVTIGLHDFYY